MQGAYYLELTIAGEKEPRGLFFSSLDEAASELRWWEQDQRLERAILRLLRTGADLPGFASSAHQAGVNPLRQYKATVANNATQARSYYDPASTRSKMIAQPPAKVETEN